MAKKKKDLTLEEKLQNALVPEGEQPYPIPENWVWIRLGGVISQIKNGTTIKQDKSVEGDKVTRIESLQKQTIDLDRLGVIADSTKIKFDDWYLENDIALSHINSIEHVGKTAIIKNYMLPLVHGMNLLRLRFYGCYEPKMFQFFTQSFQYKQAILERINMAVNQVSINQKQLSDIEIPLPPIQEQQRIVERIESLFSKLDEAKEKIQSSLDSFENRKSAILYQAFSGELTKKWREENGISLDDREEVLLKDTLYEMTSKKPSGEHFYYIDIDSVDNKKQEIRKPKIIDTSKAPSRASREVLENDTLFSMVRPYLKNIAFIDSSLSGCIASTGFYVCRPNNKIYPRYLYALLRSSIAINYTMKFMKGDNSPSIRKSDLENMPIHLPSILEQKEIVRILDNILEKEQDAEELIEVIEKIDLMKKSILARAFRGELGTNIPEEESAIELLKSVLEV